VRTIAALTRSDLRLPEPIFNALSIYLLLTIGLQGGADLSKATLSSVALPILAAFTLGLSIPLWVYLFLRRFSRFSASIRGASGFGLP
jgi:hypothetical protein